MSTLPATGYIGFALIALGMVLTPGPNMIYLISRSICQGRVAGLISLGGVALGFVFYMLCAAFGITALVFAVPYAYDALRFLRRRLLAMARVASHLVKCLFNRSLSASRRLQSASR
jgi:hypothetical protein